MDSNIVNVLQKLILSHEKKILELKKLNKKLEGENMTLKCHLNKAKEDYQLLERTVTERENIRNREKFNREISQQTNNRPSIVSLQNRYQEELKKKDAELNQLKKTNNHHAAVAEISQLKSQFKSMSLVNIESENALRNRISQLKITVDQANKDLRIAQEKSNEQKVEVERYRTRLTTSILKMEQQDEKIRKLKHELNRKIHAEVVNFPNDLLSLHSNIKGTPEIEPSLEDGLFQKELARRITCEICVHDIERLRCSQCLKGICRGCHEKVKQCPNCRNEKNNFKPIVMPRL